MSTTNFMGFEGFVWFFGVVEDRNDPLKLGRVKVRCLGLHTENKQDITTDQLPWAHPVLPITSATISGIGQTPLGLVEGTHVFGFFRDGMEAQEPVIIGSVPGIAQANSTPALGFNDPNGVYPKPEYLKEPDTNRLARNESIANTIVQTKKDNVETSIATASGGSWDEPETPYDAVYPYNHVYESESGHILEVDDSDGVERLHRYHTSGTFDEIYPDGSRVLKIQGDDYTVVIANSNMYIKGSLSITVDGDAEIYSKQNAHVKTDGDLTIETVGNMIIETGGNVTWSVGGTVDWIVSGSYALTVSGAIDIDGSTIALN